jgi:hypothetical protein
MAVGADIADDSSAHPAAASAVVNITAKA